MPKLGRYVLQFYKASLRLWWALASLDGNSPCASMAYPSCVTCCISESSVADDSWAMNYCSYSEILLPGIGIGIFTLSSRNNFCDIVTCHKSVKDNIELCNFYPQSLSQRVQRRILSKAQLFSAPLRGSSRPEKVPGVGKPNLEGPWQ